MSSTAGSASDVERLVTALGRMFIDYPTSDDPGALITVTDHDGAAHQVEADPGHVHWLYDLFDRELIGPDRSDHRMCAHCERPNLVRTAGAELLVDAIADMAKADDEAESQGVLIAVTGPDGDHQVVVDYFQVAQLAELVQRSHADTDRRSD